VAPVFVTLDWLEDHVASRRFLVSDAPTEADWRLFTTLVRFDAVYYGHFKCNLRSLIDYPNVWSYTRELHPLP
jgi:putative glutathione S-transferase